MNNNYSLTTVNSKEASDYYIVFYLKEKQYAINIKDVIEVINIPIIEIPQIAPEGIVGIFNYKGLMIKVIDICPFLGFETSDFTINNQLIVVCIEGNCFAIHTEAISNIIHINKSDLQPIPFASRNSILKDIYKINTISINIINTKALDKIVSDTVAKEGKINYLELFPQDEKSKQILELRSIQNIQKQDAFSFSFDLNTTNQYVLFTLENHNYYIDLKFIKEFTSVKRLNITKLPYTNKYIKGIINLRGDFLVVIDLKSFLNSTNNPTIKSNKIIIVEGKNYNLALLVDDIKYIKNLKDVQPSVFTDENSKYIYSEFMENNQLYSILNIEKIINDEKLYINIE